jgi:hypothetical protein
MIHGFINGNGNNKLEKINKYYKQLVSKLVINFYAIINIFINIILSTNIIIS